MPEPKTVGELMQFVYGAAWVRSNIPSFAEIAGPLYDVINDGLKGRKRKTKAAANKVKLADVPRWASEGRKALKSLKQALVDSMTTAVFDPKKVTCVMGDASQNY